MNELIGQVRRNQLDNIHRNCIDKIGGFYFDILHKTSDVFYDTLYNNMAMQIRTSLLIQSHLNEDT